MCGIVGFVDSAGKLRAEHWTETLRHMAGTLRHRGPDDSGEWIDAESGAALGHRRLSVLDLSAEGHQPMRSAAGRFVIAYNGEIYNVEALRSDLGRSGERSAWRGHSDTEVMLAAIVRWGVRGALERFNGMFAFALWDTATRTLALARDRLGEKPLYYGWMGDTFLFGSELKALRRHPAWAGEIDRDALGLFMRHSYVPAPFSIYRGIAKLEPGVLLTLPWNGGAARRAFSTERYWSARDAVLAGRAQPFDGTADEAVTQLDALLRDAVRLRMYADVPVGAFLSGGVDSSTVVALMQAESAGRARTFSIGFAESDYDEAAHARAVAKHLATAHTELVVTPADARDVIPRLPEMYDEPFADASQIPTYLVSSLARRHVTVSLSGDGGDELFGGYRRHVLIARLWKQVGWLPPRTRSALARGLMMLPPATWNRIVLPGATVARRPGDSIHKLAGILDARTPREMYGRLVSHWGNPSELVRGAIEQRALSYKDAALAFDDVTDEMMYLDLVTYLPDDILVKVDRASMATSLEARVPMLDHRVVEFAWRLPRHFKVRGGTGKWLLRRLLDRYVPRSLIDRPKTGFAVPVAQWLRSELREWAEALVDPRSIEASGFLDPELVRHTWSEHLSERRNWQSLLWNVLMWQAWLDAQGTMPPSLHAPIYR